MKRTYLYVGTWCMPNRTAPDNIGIYVFEVDQGSNALNPVQFCYTGALTSMLCISHDGKALYAVDECKDSDGIPLHGGSVLAFKIDQQDGTLTLIGRCSSMGRFPAYVSTDKSGQYLFVANHAANESVLGVAREGNGRYAIRPLYDQGTTAMFVIGENGTIQEASCVIAHPDCSTTWWPPAVGIHPHCAVVDPSDQYVLTCDKGGDVIYIHKIDREKGVLEPGEFSAVHTRPTSAPRLLTFHPEKPWFFVCNEFGSTVGMYEFDSTIGQAKELDVAVTVRPGEDPQKSMTADVKVHPAGRFVYVSNRSVKSFEPNVKDAPHSSIAVFCIDEENQCLRLVEITDTPGENPRGIELDPKGDFLYVAGADDGNLVRYRIEEGTGSLIEPEIMAQVPGPASMHFLTID